MFEFLKSKEVKQFYIENFPGEAVNILKTYIRWDVFPWILLYLMFSSFLLAEIVMFLFGRDFIILIAVGFANGMIFNRYVDYLIMKHLGLWI